MLQTQRSASTARRETLRKRKLVKRGSPAPTQVVHTTSALCSTPFSVARCSADESLYVRPPARC